MIRVRHGFFLLLTAFGWASAIGPSTASTYRITGIVVSSVDEAPVAHAHLNATLTRGGHDNRSLPGPGFAGGFSADADERGRFELTLPSSGSWRLTAAAPGFVTEAYDQHDEYSSAVVLSATQPKVDLRFQLAPEAEIAGTVIDEAGEAVRDARVTLQYRAFASPNREGEPFRNRMTIQTDDRGAFEFSGLAAGDYRVMVDAKPWYSTASQPGSLKSSLSADSLLDVTYQLTWYPGVDDPAQAETLSLAAADSRRVDFHLVPIPAVHLQFTTPSPSDRGGGRPIPNFPVLERIDNGGQGPSVIQSTISRVGPQGQVDIGGLAPGLYRLRVPGQDAGGRMEMIEITPGSSRIVDATAVSAGMANITIERVDEEDDRLPGIELRNTETGRRFTAFDTNMLSFGRGGGGGNSPQQRRRAVSLQVPPGRYEVSMGARGDAYLTGLTAKGAEVSGRFITVRSGDTVLTLHTAKGYASVNGIATADGKSVGGAMVLLVPAGLDDPGSFARLVRDQTNTDGSFDLDAIVPGPYILIAVDHGWKINWKNATTLQRYLTHGTPLDVHAETRLKQDVAVQFP